MVYFNYDWSIPALLSFLGFFISSSYGFFAPSVRVSAGKSVEIHTKKSRRDLTICTTPNDTFLRLEKPNVTPKSKNQSEVKKSIGLSTPSSVVRLSSFCASLSDTPRKFCRSLFGENSAVTPRGLVRVVGTPRKVISSLFFDTSYPFPTSNDKANLENDIQTVAATKQVIKQATKQGAKQDKGGKVEKELSQGAVEGLVSEVLSLVFHDHPMGMDFIDLKAETTTAALKSLATNVALMSSQQMSSKHFNIAKMCLKTTIRHFVWPLLLRSVAHTAPAVAIHFTSEDLMNVMNHF